MKIVKSKSGSIITAGILFIGILLLWIYKLPFLKLPFFWDEAWSYAPAVWAMYKDHPCLTPGCVAVDLYRGHPLWFYFMNAVVTKVFGFTPLVIHVFSLLVASVFIVVFYRILLRFTNPVFALLGALLLLPQEFFVVQSSFMLPEIFISMMTLVVIYYFFEHKYLLYLISAIILVMTKESGLVIIAGLGLVALIGSVRQLARKERGPASAFGYLFLISSPLIPGLAFYVFQKRIYGWYFYPLHLEMMSFTWDSFIWHVTVIRDFVFLQQGRKILVYISSLILVLTFIYSRRRKIPLDPYVLDISVSIVTVFVFYFLFSSINYLSLRYLIPLITMFFFLVCILGYQLHRLGFRLLPYLFCIAIIIPVYHDFTFNPSWIDDVSITYKDDVVVHQQAVDYMENNQYNSKKIYTFYLMKYDLTYPELFYIHGHPFNNVKSDTLVKDADFYIFSNLTLIEDQYNYIQQNDSLQLIKRFEKGKSWCEIYGRKP